MAPVALIVGAVVKAVLTQTAGSLLVSGKRDQIADEVKAVLETDPRFVNETNQEPLWQSRVVIGYITTLLGSLAIVRGEVIAHGFNVLAYDLSTEKIAAYAILAGSIYGLVGRLKSGLRPAFSWLGDVKRKFRGEKGA